MNKMMLAALALGMALSACEEKKGDAPAASSAASAKPSASGAKAAPSENKPAKAKEDPPPAAKALTVADFSKDMPGNACKALASCKNEEVTVSVGATMMLMAGLGAMDDEKAREEMKGIGETMKKENRLTLNGEECGKVATVVAGVTGFTADKIQASIDAKKVEFNGEKAGACIAALASEPSFCKDEKKVTGEPNLEALDKLMNAYEKDFDAHLKVCGEALVGKVADGEACDHDYECAGEKTRCRQKKCAAKK